jgi:predicted RND superfamily exporter protein
VLWLGLATLSVLAVGTLRLRYASDVGFGEQSYVLRSVRFIEANFRKPMTTELVVSVPAGSRVYEERTLRLLDRIERHLAAEPSTGAVWSLLDFVEEAYRIDHGKPAASLDELVAAVPRAMPIVASFERASAFWSESVREDGTTVDAARISVDRGWLDDQEQGPYLDRLRRFVAEVSADVAPEGYRVELEGGLVLAERAVTEIRATQWSSFTSAFASVSVVFGLLLFGSWRLMASAIVVNVLPVFALLGLMGWVGIGMEPANAMVAAILLGIVVDDTIHLSLRYREREEAGDDPSTAVFSALTAAGEPIVITALCLGVGFAMLTFSSWGGLASFGLLASLGIIVSAAAELLLLPAAILVRGERSAIRSASNVEA